MAVVTMARVRGAFVGAASGAVSIAAHAVGGGVVSPGGSSIALLIAACTVIGVVVGGRSARHRVVDVMVLLTLGQAVGHLALTMSPGHHHGSHATPVMLAAHLVAVPVGAVLIRGAEIAVARAISAAGRAVRVLESGPAPGFEPISPVPLGPLPAYRRLLLSCGAGLRGPPVHA